MPADHMPRPAQAPHGLPLVARRAGLAVRAVPDGGRRPRGGRLRCAPPPLPHRTYDELVGGPLDGPLLDITGWRPKEIDGGVVLMIELGRWPGSRTLYDPRSGDPRPSGGPGVVCRFYYSGDTP